MSDADFGTLLARLEVGGTTVAGYSDGTGLDRTLAPRPFLHPVTTLGGVTVTDAVPDDHHWHVGISVAVQDAGGVNLWGGRTYLRDEGYTWQDDHGTIRHRQWHRREPGLLDHDLDWCGPDGTAFLVERRTLTARAVSGGWALDFAFSLRNNTDRAILLGSPATNGRDGAGYGGFFWRLPLAAGESAVRTADAAGETGVHESRSPWLAYRGDDGNPDRRFTVVLRAGDERTAEDFWFVRMKGYPGLGSALATYEPLRLDPGTRQTRRLTAMLLDGHLPVSGDENAWSALVSGHPR